MHRSLLSLGVVLADALVSGVTLTQSPPWPVVAVMAVVSFCGIALAARTIGDGLVPRD